MNPIESMPNKRFLILCSLIMDTIDEIDKDTEWQEFEPQWWLDMMKLQKEVYHILNPES
jgi:hypothetical protein